MKLDDQRESDHVEDRRGGLGAKGSIGIGTVVIALVAWYFGIDPQTRRSTSTSFSAATCATGSAPASTPEA